MAATEVSRQEWADGYRRLASERENGDRYRRLLAQTEAITDELRRRIGSVFTLAELAAEYRGSETWVAGALEQLPREAQYLPDMAVATDAAFHLYARGARDYVP
jgi:hypothetical protein